MTIIIEDSGSVRTIIHDRFEARNAMDPVSGDQLAAALRTFDSDESVAVAVLWGAGGAFCAGWDLKYAAELSEQPDPLAPYDYPTDSGTDEVPRGPMGPTRLELSKPVIAAIEGPAVAGGMEIALWCDLRVMAEDAYMGVYCRRWGVPLIDGGTVRLPRLIGQGRALDLILTGRKVTAQECLAIGLCERVVESGGARPAAESLAEKIANFPQACVQADRASVYMQYGLDLDRAMRNEFEGGKTPLSAEGLAGANRFSSGRGRHGDFDSI